MKDTKWLYSKGYEDGLCYLPFADQDERVQFVMTLSKDELEVYYKGFDDGYSFVERIGEEVPN